MIISEVTAEQLTEWKNLYVQKKDVLKPNRISGLELNDYFQSEYSPAEYHNEAFRNVVYQNVREHALNISITDIATYVVDDDVFVGIDLQSGYFHVECTDITKAVPVWNQLFVKRGLDENDLSNYVVTAQYLLLTEK